MQRKRTWLAAAVIGILSFSSAAAELPLIERSKLFGNPSRAQGQLSPDGRWLAWLAPKDGVLNIWVAPSSAPAQARPLTSETIRPIGEFFWSPDSATILFVNDAGGDENFQLHGADVATGRRHAFTNSPKARTEVIKVSRQVKDRILIGLNDRDPNRHDVYSLDLKTGQLKLVFRNDGYTGFTADEQLHVRIATKARSDGGLDFHWVNGQQVDRTPFATVGFEDSITTRPLGFAADGRTLYWVDSRGRDTAALVAQDVGSGKSRELARDARSDIRAVMTAPRSGAVDAYSAEYLRNEWIAVDSRIAPDLKLFAARLAGQFTVTSRSSSDQLWTVEVDPVTAPSTTYLYDRRTKSLSKLFTSRPELEDAPLVAMHPVEIAARDGLRLVSYLSLPPGSDPDGDGRPDKPVPLVLLVHGGPWARDSFGYDPYAQWIANRGYAALLVNFRGSAGFGKKFISAGDMQWGAGMQDDLLDAVHWAVAAGITTRDKVAILGGSYGGYATLAGLTETPDAYACGVDIVGPSDLAPFIDSFPSYFEAARLRFFKRVGDPRTEEGRAFLRARSPLFKADRIRRPLLIAHGANDPRVPKLASDAIVAAMAAKNIPVTYMVFPDEGHGFGRPENSLAFSAVAESFLAKCLGGRAEPIGDALKASSAEVPHGAEFTPGLEAALAAR